METLLVWDIDGTLVRGNGAGRRAMNRAFEAVFGIADAFSGIPMAGALDLAFMAEVFRRHGVDKGRLNDFLERYYRELQAEYRPDKVELLPGVVEVLEAVEADGSLYNALGTGNVEVGARIKLDTFDLNRFFPVGGFCERPVDRSVVLANAVEQAKAFYGVEFEPEQVVVIGDTVRDIEAARKIGARVIAVATGGSSYDELEAAGPDLLLWDLANPEPVLSFCRRE
ncbi:MAG: HAD hydrolase-like protein [Alicyclobacillus sp.]|nr:HAD hydrolase-like protein [Alicyclobacillus sp.]